MEPICIESSGTKECRRSTLGESMNGRIMASRCWTQALVGEEIRRSRAIVLPAPVECEGSRREGVPAQVSSTSLHGSKLRGPSPKSPRVAEQCDVNIKSINQINQYCSSLQNTCGHGSQVARITTSCPVSSEFEFWCPTEDPPCRWAIVGKNLTLAWCECLVSEVQSQMSSLSLDQVYVDNIYCMITTNIDVTDGLANGAVRKLIHVETNDEGLVKTIWLEFSDLPQIGGKLRHEKKISPYLYKITE
ncbi:hypothetical protein TNCV_4549631 [Trichonephila clavipes]|nr:hypothetical protein TNCV_4549631 [Trichonephila clavipes]